jgi:hypothetical protein
VPFESQVSLQDGIRLVEGAPVLSEGTKVAFAIGGRHAPHVVLLKDAPLRPCQHLLIDVGAQNLVGATRRQLMQQNRQAVCLRSVGTARTPKPQTETALQQQRQNLPLQNLELLRVAEQLRHINGKSVDEGTQARLVLQQMLEVVREALEARTLHHRPDSAIGLVEFVLVQVKPCALIQLLLEPFEIVQQLRRSRHIYATWEVLHR